MTNTPTEFTDWSTRPNDEARKETDGRETSEGRILPDGGVELDRVSAARRRTIQWDQSANKYQSGFPKPSPAKSTWHTRDVSADERPKYRRLHNLQHGRGHTYEGFRGQRIHLYEVDKFIRSDAILQRLEIPSVCRRWALRMVMTTDLRGFSRHYNGADGATIGFALLVYCDTPEEAKQSKVASWARSSKVITCEVDKLIEYVFWSWS